MRFDAAGQRTEMVAAFEARNDTSLSMALRNTLELPSDPGVVLILQAELSQSILAMRVKTGTDEDHLRLKGLQTGYPVGLDQGTNLRAPCVRRHRKVEQIGCARLCAAVGVERMLKKLTIKMRSSPATMSWVPLP